MGNDDREEKMDLTVLQPGMELSLGCAGNGGAIELKVEVMEVISTCVVVKPIMHDGKMLDFSTSDLDLTLMILDGEKLFGWEHVVVKAGILRGRDRCHLIYCVGEAVNINRRKSFRVYFGCSGWMKRLNGASPEEVTVRDVSNEGVGIICQGTNLMTVNELVDLEFSHREVSGIKLHSRVVRVRELKDGRVEYGCKIVKAPANLTQFLTKKQLEIRRNAMKKLTQQQMGETPDEN